MLSNSKWIPHFYDYNNVAKPISLFNAYLIFLRILHENMY